MSRTLNIKCIKNTIYKLYNSDRQRENIKIQKYNEAIHIL